MEDPVDVGVCVAVEDMTKVVRERLWSLGPSRLKYTVSCRRCAHGQRRLEGR